MEMKTNEAENRGNVSRLEWNIQFDSNAVKTRLRMGNSQKDKALYESSSCSTKSLHAGTCLIVLVYSANCFEPVIEHTKLQGDLQNLSP